MLSKSTETSKLLIATNDDNLTDNFMTCAEWLARTCFLNCLNGHVVTRRYNTKLIVISLVIKIYRTVVHCATTGTSLIVRASTHLKPHFFGCQIEANHTTKHAFVLRQPVEKLGSIVGVHSRTRPRHIANPFAHTHAGLVRLQSLLSDCHTCGADKNNCRPQCQHVTHVLPPR